MMRPAIDRGGAQPELDRAAAFGVLAGAWAYVAGDLAVLSMGLDGVIYAAIALFYAAGDGSFWALPTFEAELDAFHDHPPLGIWLQSLWFAAAGDAFWVERVWCLGMMAAVAGLMAALWRAVAFEFAPGSGAWWPLALLFIMPVTTYVLKNNALESMVTVAALGCILAAWHGRRRPWLDVVVGAGCALGFLIKGPVALFPLAAPACFALIIDRRFARAVGGSTIAGAVCFGILGSLLVWAPVEAFARHYFDAQIVASLSGERPAVNGRATQLVNLGANVAAAGAAGLVAWFFVRRLRISRAFFAMLALGLLSSLPLLLSPRQFRHYLLPSLPFFAIAIALLMPALIPRRRVGGVWLVAAVLLTAGGVRAWSQFGEAGGDASELEDAARIAALAPEAAHISFCEEQLKLRAYLARHHGRRSSVITPGRGHASHPWVVCAAGRLPEHYDRVGALSGARALWRSARRG